MSWQIGFDERWKRHIGYGVPAICDHPDCNEAIDRGLAFVCGGEPYGGEKGCGLYFCGKHLILSARRPQLCARCHRYNHKPFIPKADTVEWIRHKLTDRSWRAWRKENPGVVKALKAAVQLGGVLGKTDRGARSGTREGACAPREEEALP